MSKFRHAIETHPLPWFFGAVSAAFIAGASAYQAVLSWSGHKMVRDEATMKLAVRVEPTPTDAAIALNQEAGKFFQGMPLPDGSSEFVLTREGYRSQTVRLARTGGTLVLSVSLPRTVQLTATDSMQYTGEKMSINFTDIDLRALFQVIGDFTGASIVVGRQVKGNVTMKLTDVPWDQVVDLVALQAGLDVRRSGKVIFISTP